MNPNATGHGLPLLEKTLQLWLAAMVHQIHRVHGRPLAAQLVELLIETLRPRVAGTAGGTLAPTGGWLAEPSFPNEPSGPNGSRGEEG